MARINENPSTLPGKEVYQGEVTQERYPKEGYSGIQQVYTRVRTAGDTAGTHYPGYTSSCYLAPCYTPRQAAMQDFCANAGCRRTGCYRTGCYPNGLSILLLLSVTALLLLRPLLPPSFSVRHCSSFPVIQCPPARLSATAHLRHRRPSQFFISVPWCFPHFLAVLGVLHPFDRNE